MVRIGNPLHCINCYIFIFFVYAKRDARTTRGTRRIKGETDSHSMQLENEIKLKKKKEWEKWKWYSSWSCLHTQKDGKTGIPSRVARGPVGWQGYWTGGLGTHSSAQWRRHKVFRKVTIHINARPDCTWSSNQSVGTYLVGSRGDTEKLGYTQPTEHAARGEKDALRVSPLERASERSLAGASPRFVRKIW